MFLNMYRTSIHESLGNVPFKFIWQHPQCSLPNRISENGFIINDTQGTANDNGYRGKTISEEASPIHTREKPYQTKHWQYQCTHWYYIKGRKHISINFANTYRGETVSV